LKEETVNEEVESAWARVSAQGQTQMLMTKLNQVHADLHTWDMEILRKPSQQKKRLHRELEELRRGPMMDDSIAAQKEILLRLELLLEQEEIFWVQRARANWLKHGDRNTNFFITLPLAGRRKIW
jgi:23S rRNA maturation mini-RNase III